MLDAQLLHQPTVKQLLSTEAFSEAQIFFGEEFTERQVMQVVSSPSPRTRAASLIVCPLESVIGLDASSIKGAAGLVLIRHANSESFSSATVASGVVSNRSPVIGAHEVAIKRIANLCKEEKVPLILIPAFGDPVQISEDVRLAFLRELKLSTARLHSTFLTVLLDEGLDGLIEAVSTSLNRPLVVESADFKVLSSRNMGATPASQQKTLQEESAKSLKKRSISGDKQSNQKLIMPPIRLGRRLVVPIILSESVVGYIAVMVRPTDDVEAFGEYLQAAALATMVDFNQRRRDGSVFTVTQQSLLKDLLLGSPLSASDLERLERHYGFDLCDGLLVFAVDSSATVGDAYRMVFEDGFASTEIEGTRVFIVPHVEKNLTSWQDEAKVLIDKLKGRADKNSKIKIQLGAARMVSTILDLPEAYREARQALIIGSMMNGDDAEFVVGYGDLGIKRLLYLMIDHPELERFYEENLALLESYDTEWESELVPSLRVYLEQGANLNSAARALFIHRHTLRYRLEQMADILKVDIDSQEVLLNLQIAFLIRDMRSSIRGKSK